MAIRERLIYAIDVVTDGAKKGLSGFRSDVAAADGTVNKFKAGASSAFATVQANAGALALGAGAALATFGAKAVSAFIDVSKAAVDGSAATGIAIEDYSRWIAVADDMEVSAESLQTGLGKISKSLDSGKWETYGVATRDAAGNARDANDVLLDAFDALGKIGNETERARVGNELFGKGYSNLAPLVGKTREEYEAYLGAVEDGQVITAEEAAKAERTRLALDKLRDSIQEVTLAFGQRLSPIVADAAETVDHLIASYNDLADLAPGGKGGPVGGFVNGLISPFKALGGAMDITNRATGALDDALGGAVDTANQNAEVVDTLTGDIAKMAAAERESTDAINTGNESRRDKARADWGVKDAADAAAEATAEQAEWDEKAAEMADRHAEAVEAVADAMEEQFDAALELVGGDIAVRNAQRDAAEAAEELSGVLEDQETTLADAGAAIDDAAQAQLDAAQAAADYRAKQMEANGQSVDAKVQAQLFKEELQNLVGQLDGPLAAALQRYIDQLGAIPTTVGTRITLTTPGRVGDIVGTQGRLTGGIQRFASGGVVGGPIGQPQLAIVEGGETVVPTHKAGVGMGGVYNVTLNVTQALSPDEVVQLVKKYERFNGSRWRT